MQDRLRYHIIIDSIENVDVVREYLEQSQLTDLKTWKAFPLLINASLTPVQVSWLRKHPMILSVEPNNSIFLHAEPKQYELKIVPGSDQVEIRKAIFDQFDINMWQYDTLPDSLFTILNEDQYNSIIRLIGTTGVWAQITGPFVSVGPVREYSRVLNLSRYNWGVERITHRNTNLFERVAFTENGSFGGQRVNVFVIDNGVQSNHDELRGRVSSDRFDAFRDVSDPLYGEPSTETRLVDGVLELDDHGTHVASIIAGSTVGVATNALVYSVRAYSQFENSTTENLLDAVDWVIQTHQQVGGPSIANMSFGIQESDIGGKRIGEIITTALIGAGIVTIASAGNDATDAFFSSPGNAGTKREIRVEGTKYFLDTIIDDAVKPITVGASVNPRSSTRNVDTIWKNSNWGDVVDLFAPGVNIYSASLQPVGEQVDLARTGSYSIKSGTSMAAPHVAGICALQLSNNPSLTHLELRELVAKQATSNPFTIAEVRNERIDPPRYLEQGATNRVIPIENKLVYSPNKLAYAWFTLNSISWAEQSYDFELNELTRLESTIQAESTNYYGDNELVDYQIEQVDVPAEYPASFPDNYTTTDYSRTLGNIVENKNTLNLRINAPSVPADRTGIFEVQAYDGRVRGFRRFTITTKNVPAPPVWVSPPSGQLLSVPTVKGDIFNKSVVEFVATQEDNLSISYIIIPLNGSLPLGLNLQYDAATNTAFLSGTVVQVPYSQELIKYEFLIRATASNGLIAERLFSLVCKYVNTPHTFNPDWLAGFYEVEPGIRLLPPGRIGNSYYQGIDVINDDNDVLDYAIDFVPSIVETPTTFNGRLPTGLGVYQDGSIRGIVDPTAILGNYYFRLTVTDLDGNEIHQDFRMGVEIGEDDVLQESDQIIWITPPGSIGNIYETFPSHVSVEAINPEGSPVYYSVSPNAGPLPDGLTVDTNTGYIMGFAPFVSANTTYTFAIRATVGSRFVDRTFSITILNQYNTTSVRNVKGRITGYERLEFKEWLFNSPTFTNDVLFRPGDPNFGVTEQIELYVVSGLNSKVFNESGHEVSMLEVLKDYHQRMYLYYGNVTFAPVYDPSGAYVYDIVYVSVIDPQAKAGGFDANGVEQVLTLPQSHPYKDDPYFWDGTTELSRFFPNSLHNAREDLISTKDGRLGFGLAGEEGFPMWMRTTSNPNNSNLQPRGYTPAVVLAYVKPGKGLAVTNQLALRGFNTQFQGRNLIIDRYYVSNSLIAALTIFDNNMTTFDVPGEPLTCLSPVECTWDETTQTQTCDPNAGQIVGCDPLESQTDATQFDVGTTELGKYYKFDDDGPILKDRENNQYR